MNLIDKIFVNGVWASLIDAPVNWPKNQKKNQKRIIKKKRE